jgi:hypothetical protein
MAAFPNKAGDHHDTDDLLKEELKAAGIPTLQEAAGANTVFLNKLLRSQSGEVKTSVTGTLHGWTFKRAWVYWICSGPGIEVEAAERLHASHGTTVRVDGHSSSPSPREWFKGLACGGYHVDDEEGLKALADTIRGLVQRADPAHGELPETAAPRVLKDRNVVSLHRTKPPIEAAANLAPRSQPKGHGYPKALPYNLSELQKAAKQTYEISPEDTRSLACTLYEGRAISYPISDCQYLGQAQIAEVTEVLGCIEKVFPAAVADLRTKGIAINPAIFNDDELLAHHAIIPTAATFDIASFPTDARRLYTLICKQYLRMLSA